MNKAHQKEIAFELPDYGVPMTLVRCPAGRFMMGSPETETGHYLNEALHEEVIADEFWIGKYAVTQAQYESVTGENPSGHNTIGLLYDDHYPVDRVAHQEAEKFCAKLNETLPVPGWQFDLPTSVQWEYACRAGSSSALNNGTEITKKYGRCPNLAKVGWHCFDKVPFPQSVGLKEPNVWGLYDMHGNVSEWCKEKYIHVSAKQHPRGIDGYIVRGGSYFAYPKYCRAACIYGGTGNFFGEPDAFYRFFWRGIGFRIVLRKCNNTGNK